jgi:hypothetical protein
MVEEQHGDGVVMLPQAPQNIEGSGAGVGAQNAEARTVAASEIALDGPQNIFIIIYREDSRPRHVTLTFEPVIKRIFSY